MTAQLSMWWWAHRCCRWRAPLVQSLIVGASAGDSRLQWIVSSFVYQLSLSASLAISAIARLIPRPDPTDYHLPRSLTWHYLAESASIACFYGELQTFGTFSPVIQDRSDGKLAVVWGAAFQRNHFYFRMIQRALAFRPEVACHHRFVIVDHSTGFNLWASVRYLNASTSKWSGSDEFSQRIKLLAAVIRAGSCSYSSPLDSLN